MIGKHVKSEVVVEAVASGNGGEFSILEAAQSATLCRDPHTSLRVFEESQRKIARQAVFGGPCCELTIAEPTDSAESSYPDISGLILEKTLDGTVRQAISRGVHGASAAAIATQLAGRGRYPQVAGVICEKCHDSVRERLHFVGLKTAIPESRQARPCADPCSSLVIYRLYPEVAPL